MAYRFTNTDKWNDSWFLKLKPLEKLLFNYMCDNCNNAGFIELNERQWAVDICVEVSDIEGALEGLTRGLIKSNTNDCYYIRNFLKHQKNLPLNMNNPAHKGIVGIFQLYMYKFDITDINQFIEGASKGLTWGIGNGIVR